MTGGRRPTMRDVAAAADVSFKTVSRVVNREGGVRPELIDRVEAAVAELGYRPDHRARGLRLADAGAVTIGFVMVDMSNPFFSHVFRGVEDVASDRDCLVLTGSTDGSADREEQLIETFVGRRVDGLIVATAGPGTPALESEVRRGTPVVFVDIEPELAPVDLVRSDHLAGTTTLTEHLLAHGHRDVAYFGDDRDMFSSRLRLEGFLRAMGDQDISVPDHRIVTGRHDEYEWRDIVTDYLSTGTLPTALISAQNFVSIGAARALNDLGLRRRVAQVGFDDVEFADLIEPGLTVVTQQPRDIGRRAAQALFARLDGNDGPPSSQILPVPLIARGSGELPPSEPSAVD